MFELPMHETLDTCLRLIIIGQLSIVGLVAWLRGPVLLGRATVMLVLSILGYVIASSPMLSAAAVLFRPAAIAGATAVPYALWWFASVVFEFRLPHRAWLILPAIAVFAWFVDLAPGADGTLDFVMNVVTRLASLIAVGHVLYAVLVDRRDDLFEPRRRFRLLFFGLIALFVFTTVVVELILMGPAPLWLQLTSAVYIEALVLVLGVPLARGTLVAGSIGKSTPAPATDEPLTTALLAAMADRAYAQPGLTVEALASQLGVPEAKLRQLINGSLEFRNFSTFINGYRIEEAASRLRDPEEAHLPVLSIALDVGFASIGPFNRAFKQIMDTTPSAFRKRE